MDSVTQLQSLKKPAKLERAHYVATAHFGYADFFKKAFKELAP
jgi:hypothetical protein